MVVLTSSHRLMVMVFDLGTPGQEAYTAITTWDLDVDQHDECLTTGQTVPIPTNQRSGQCGLLLLNRINCRLDY